eukprot:scaffold144748_cov33-Tisochrysis_lutea.AAC.3
MRRHCWSAGLLGGCRTQALHVEHDAVAPRLTCCSDGFAELLIAREDDAVRLIVLIKNGCRSCQCSGHIEPCQDGSTQRGDRRARVLNAMNGAIIGYLEEEVAFDARALTTERSFRAGVCCDTLVARPWLRRGLMRRTGQRGRDRWKIVDVAQSAPGRRHVSGLVNERLSVVPKAPPGRARGG